MPKSKSKRRAYQPPPKPKPKPSPRWLGPGILIFMFGGVLLIVLNYLEVIPGSQGPSNQYLWIGLGLIAVGFGAATQLR